MSLGAGIGGSLMRSPVGRDGVGECNHEIDRTQHRRLSPGAEVPQLWTRNPGHTVPFRVQEESDSALMKQTHPPYGFNDPEWMYNTTL